MRITKIATLLLGMVPFTLAAASSPAATSLAGPNSVVQKWTETYYIQLSFDMSVPMTAYMFDENFNQYPNSSWDPNTSSVKFPVGPPRFMLGGHYRMVTRDSAGTVTDVSAIPSFTEMNHHMVMGATFAQYGNYTEFPVSAGSELTSFRFPAGYGYPMEGAELGPATWHWSNVTAVAGLDQTGSGGSPDLGVFLEVKLTFSNKPNLTWIYSRWQGDLGMCVQENSVGYIHNTVPSPLSTTAKTRVIFGLPHVHDHMNWAELRRIPTSGGDLLMHGYTPDNSMAHPVEHDDCGLFGQPLTWHVHGTGVGHLPVGGLQAHVYHPGSAGPVLQPGELLYVKGSFNNPHAQPIDNMLAYLLYYEILP